MCKNTSLDRPQNQCKTSGSCTTSINNIVVHVHDPHLAVMCVAQRFPSENYSKCNGEIQTSLAIQHPHDISTPYTWLKSASHFRQIFIHQLHNAEANKVSTQQLPSKVSAPSVNWGMHFLAMCAALLHISVLTEQCQRRSNDLWSENPLDRAARIAACCITCEVVRCRRP